MNDLLFFKRIRENGFFYNAKKGILPLLLTGRRNADV